MESQEIKKLRDEIERLKIKIESGLKILHGHREEREYQLEIIRQMENDQYNGPMERINAIYRLCDQTPDCGLSITDVVHAKEEEELQKIQELDDEIDYLERRLNHCRKSCAGVKDFLNDLRSKQRRIFDSKIRVSFAKAQCKILFDRVSKINFYTEKIESRKKETEMLKRQLKFLNYRPDMRYFSDPQVPVKPSQNFMGVKNYQTDLITRAIELQREKFDKHIQNVSSFNPANDYNMMMRRIRRRKQKLLSDKADQFEIPSEEQQLLKIIEEQNERIKTKQAELDQVKKKCAEYTKSLQAKEKNLVNTQNQQPQHS